VHGERVGQALPFGGAQDVGADQRRAVLASREIGVVT